MSIVIVIIMVIAAVAFFFWMLNYTLTKTCPHCHADGNEEMVIPIVPGFIWWCPNCDQTSKQSNLTTRAKKEPDKQA